MALYRDTVPRLTLADVRGRYKPAVFNTLELVAVEAGGFRADIKIVKTAHPTCIGGYRRVFECPSCGRRALTVGCVDGLGWRCPARDCGGWRGRNRTSPPSQRETARPNAV